MKRYLLSTAILAALSTAALAQSAPDGLFRPGADSMELRTSTFIGMRVYASETAVDGTELDGVQSDWNDIGEINDVILSRDGMVEAVLVDIGGFLGMGERQVAVDMSAIKFVGDASTNDDAADFFVVMTAARADLEAAPDYVMGNAGSMSEPTATDTMAVDGAIAADAMGSPVTREGYMTAEADYLTSEKLTGAAVYDANDDVIGEIGTLVLTDDGQVSKAIVDVGGFLGMGEKPVALDLTELQILRNEAGDDVRVYLQQTKEQLEALPNFEG